MSTAIAIEHVSKTYRLGRIGAGTVHEDFGRWWAWLRGKPDPLSKVDAHPSERLNGGVFRALDDISLTVEQGEVLGVIGRNGAGKSTLLKILSQVTAPTRGQVKLWGRVGSLLEVGTGFHPDLTGRENIFLNGAILGMTKAEIRRNFDEIVAFSECETFIDTPVKRYSSGMYVRLAFAVAAHLEPEILIVDEVLAVGDAPFQKKCLGKMKDVSQHGRTVLFVSHSMAAISALCNRAVLLRDGRLAAMDATSRIVAAYQADSPAVKHSGLTVADMPRTGSGKARFTSFRMTVTDQQGQQLENVVPGSDVTFEGRLECQTPISDANVGVVIYDLHGYRLVDVNTAIQGEFVSLRAGQTATIQFILKDLRLKPGDYSVTVFVGRAHIEEIDHVQGAITLQVLDPVSAKHSESFPGVYRCDFSQKLVVH